MAGGTTTPTARKSISRKQLQFAPLQLGRTSEQPHASPNRLGMVDELMSPSRSKSLGSAVDRALLMDAVDAESALSKDRPRSATQFSRKVGHDTIKYNRTLDGMLYVQSTLCVVCVCVCVA